MKFRQLFLIILILTQILCASFFLYNIITTVFGFRTNAISWQVKELLEISASLGLLLGSILGGRAIIIARKEQQKAEKSLRSAATAFSIVVDEKLSSWGLTNSEQDVAWFVIKGFSNAEISNLRGSSEGTIKAQLNAVYRKSGSTGRAQMISLLVDDLLMKD